MKQVYTTLTKFISLEYLPFHNWIEKCFFSGLTTEPLPVLIRITNKPLSSFFPGEKERVS
jgi:hypothetical protein